MPQIFAEVVIVVMVVIGYTLNKLIRERTDKIRDMLDDIKRVVDRMETRVSGWGEDEDLERDE